ncbi:MAG: hypothetical protein VB074_01720 [Proteiniphilum sp.]|uniref:hypothetical protein n=1 Tax=Proteiniphilum sp. TaxID=1926877 RepID=UPI00092BE3A5|nr:hypothetical protein [Proteiniphilum sp.]MEA5126878.1 hypothetical protein [Proteiniphilum sp.]OJV81677.1 MAG: hypothetical protein BGO34_09725 [Bacteroidia bacterium 44-10]
MKKIYFSLITIAILLFTACNNDVPGNGEAVETGTLTATISFETKQVTPDAQANLRAGESTAIPVVSWNNVKQVQLFLYDAGGTIKFSRILKPADATNPESNNARNFIIPNVPLGNYKLALLANASMAGDNVTTSLDKGVTWGVEFNGLNVIGQKIDDILVGVKPKALPTIPVIEGAENQQAGWGTRKGFDKPSELFTAFVASVDVVENQTKQVEVPALKREISMMRTRFDFTTVEVPEEAAQREYVKFDTQYSFIVVQTLPDYFSLDSGVSETVNDDNVFVGATGTGTYKDADPTEGYSPTVIKTGLYTHWNDFHVLPNVKGRGTAVNGQYFIIIGAWIDLPEGKSYKDREGKITTTSQPVYWWAPVNEPFTRNVIREVNLTLKTPGYLEFPDKPTGQGSLEIIIGAPEPWNSTIVSTNMDI